MSAENKNGHQVLSLLLEAFNKDSNSVLSVFTPEAIVEYPYAKSIGAAPRLTMDEYRVYLDNILGSMPNIVFTGLSVYPLQEKDSYWAEFHGETVIPATGALNQQDYVVNFSVENGKISYYKEYWNVLPALQLLMDREEAYRLIDKR
ncbi:nuclear transport factor 2 family protein [Pedobacter sp. KACC 23697]|uniref:Nuclear transport factor 2 family protein n=1 Tax=Pedobacter sp. KACC 23697 TaxID=3149230 RepID=A0AAU7K7V6_9SPHI